MFGSGVRLILDQGTIIEGTFHGKSELLREWAKHASGGRSSQMFGSPEAFTAD
jgi:hypothetical protein